jgi:hypothetical protein
MNARAFDPESPAARKLRARVTNRLAFGAYLATKLPMGWLAGLRVEHLDARSCRTSVRYRWLTQNPFRSTYFAVLAMAAELSTGALGLSLVRAAPEPVSILVTGIEGTFIKKATDTTTFTCEDGEALQAAILQTLETREGVEVETRSVGRNRAGDEVCRFVITWSLKVRERSGGR